MATGAGIFILVNANAKRGGRRIAVQIARALPGASVRLTRSIEEVEGWLRATLAQAQPIRGILSAGGDGSAITLLNALDRVVPKDQPLPVVGALPLGTGNAWAHALGARTLDACVRALSAHEGPLPTRRYALFRCDGVLTFFGGCGWDAQVLNDYRAQLKKSPSSRLAKSVWGYLTAVGTRTVPKTLLLGPTRVLIENLGEEVFRVTDAGTVERIAQSGPGYVLYDGPATVASAATCPEYGYGFRAFPFAERMLGAVNVRVYNEHPVTAVRNIPKLWRGAHPLPGLYDWFATRVRMTFSRPMPLQIGGEACGERITVDFEHSDRLIDAVDWRMLGL